ncbi:MAG: pyruvate synthase subunit PorB [Candidatus Aenigmatarchaeota archaeon]
MSEENKNEKLFYPGQTSCAGCPETIAIHHVLKAAGKNTIVVNATGCTEIFTTQYPTTAWGVNYIHVAFENAGAVASGVRAALDKLKQNGNVIAIAGDGGTYDIGLQALSGMLERGHKVLYICMDNEAYANTGVQRSGATPYAASTTTSPSGKKSIGNQTWKKSIIEIVAAHHIPYVATASIANPNDLENKVKKALAANGPSFINVHCPCPPGWRFGAGQTVNIAKMAVETGMWVLLEIENGTMRINQKPKFTPIADYLKTQGRFKHIKDSEIEKIQAHVYEEWKHYEAFEKKNVKL